MDRKSAMLLAWQGLDPPSQWFNIILLRMVCVTKEPVYRGNVIDEDERPRRWGDEGIAPLLKSSDPHVAGGNKTQKCIEQMAFCRTSLKSMITRDSQELSFQPIH